MINKDRMMKQVLIVAFFVLAAGVSTAQMQVGVRMGASIGTHPRLNLQLSGKNLVAMDKEIYIRKESNKWALEGDLAHRKFSELYTGYQVAVHEDNYYYADEVKANYLEARFAAQRLLYITRTNSGEEKLKAYLGLTAGIFYSRTRFEQNQFITPERTHHYAYNINSLFLTGGPQCYLSYKLGKQLNANLLMQWQIQPSGDLPLGYCNVLQGRVGVGYIFH
jgi:hypothetical protein